MQVKVTNLHTSFAKLLEAGKPGAKFWTIQVPGHGSVRFTRSAEHPDSFFSARCALMAQEA